MIELSTEPTEDALAQAVRVSNTVVERSTPNEAARALLEVATAPELEPVLHAIAAALRLVAQSSGRLYTVGTSKLIIWEPVDTAQRVLEILEAGDVEPLMPNASPNAVTVRIGGELPLADLRDLSLIATGYQFGKRAGTVGILGPTRMDYPMVMSTVAEVAATLSRVLRQLGP